jgi:hypothetical protein
MLRAAEAIYVERYRDVEQYNRFGAAVRYDSVGAAVRYDSVGAAVRYDSVGAAVRYDSVGAAVRYDSVAEEQQSGMRAYRRSSSLHDSVPEEHQDLRYEVVRGGILLPLCCA